MGEYGKPTAAEVREMVEKLRETSGRVSSGPMQYSGGGICGQTIEASMRSTYRRISDWDMSAMDEAADMLTALTPQENEPHVCVSHLAMNGQCMECGALPKAQENADD